MYSHTLHQTGTINLVNARLALLGNSTTESSCVQLCRSVSTAARFFLSVPDFLRAGSSEHPTRYGAITFLILPHKWTHNVSKEFRSSVPTNSLFLTQIPMPRLVRTRP